MASTLSLQRDGAVRFIDWLDVWRFRTNAHTEMNFELFPSIRFQSPLLEGCDDVRIRVRIAG